MSILLPAEEEDFPPSGDEEAEEGGEEEEEEQNPDPAPKTIRPSPLASIRQSAPKRQKPAAAATTSAANPFEETPEAKLALLEENAEEGDCCIICKGWFTFPVIECLECKNCMCQACLEAWSKTVNSRNTSGIEVVAKCPGCRSTKGYQENSFLNRLLGRKHVRCERCNLKISQDDLKVHIAEKCTKRKIACLHSKFGCDWVGTIDARDEHQQLCIFQKAGLAKEKFDEMKASFQLELQEMRREKDLLMDDLESTIEKARKNLESHVSALSGLQRAAVHGEVSTFMKGRRMDTVSATMRSANNRSLDLQIRIELDADRFYSLHVSFVDPTARFPIWLAVFLLDPKAKGIDTPCKVASFYFRSPKESFLLYDEVAEWPTREEAMSHRQDIIQFGIAGSILLSGESRT